MASGVRQARARDERYLQFITDALRVCREYKPSFGQRGGKGVALERFRQLYQDDAFYSWFGLDSPLVYAAHKAAGGMTSIYRQIGIGCQRLFQRIIEDTLNLSSADATWAYQVPTTKKRPRTLSLDGRIPLEKVGSGADRSRVRNWLTDAASCVGLKGKRLAGLEGCVFEVRQGYKSNDAKRQNADIANAASAFAHGYLPVMVLLSVQIPESLAERYVRSRWLLLRGTTFGSAVDSTYVFSREVLGFDLADFFTRNATAIRAETQVVLEGLLR